MIKKMPQFEDRVVANRIVHPEMKAKSYSSSSTKVTLDKVKNPRNPRFLLRTLSKEKNSNSKTQVIEAFVMFISHNIFNLNFNLA